MYYLDEETKRNLIQHENQIFYEAASDYSDDEDWCEEDENIAYQTWCDMQAGC